MADSNATAGDRRKLILLLTAGVAAIAVLIWLVTGQTTAGFTDTTENAGNIFEAGSITIDSDNPGAAILESPDLLPGDSVSGSITVVNESSAPLKLKIFALEFVELPDTSSGIAENLNVLITRTDTGGDPAEVFDGTLDELQATHVDFASGVSAAAGGDELASTADAAGDVDATYAFTVTLDPGAGRPSQNVDQGDTARVKIVFEGRA